MYIQSIIGHSHLIEVSASFITVHHVLVGDVHEQVEIFQNVVNTIYCKSCPLKIKYVSQKRLEKPWLTSGILKSIKMKSFYFKQFKLGLIDDNFNKMYKNRLTVVIRNAKRLYYKNAFDSYKKNINPLWTEFFFSSFFGT